MPFHSLKTKMLPVALVALTACGGARTGMLSPTFPDNRASDVQSVLGRLATTPPASRPVAVGVSTDPPALFAHDLAAGRELFRETATVESGPHVAGNLVITHEPAGVVARGLDDGQVRFTVDDESMHLMGAGGEGDDAAFVLSTGGGVGASSRLVVARGGSIAWEATVDQALGSPAVRAGMIFLPWGSQNLSVISAADGSELARVRVADDVLATAVARRSGVYVGRSGVFRFDAAVTSGARQQASWLGPGEEELPGSPLLLRDAYTPPPPPRGAQHRVRLEVLPTPDGEMGAVNDTVYLVYYKLVFGLSPDATRVRWVHRNDRDVIGAVAREDGILIADEGGAVALLSADDGRPIPVADLGAEPQVVALRDEGLAPSGAPEGPPASLTEQLLAAAMSTDARLVPARVFAIHRLTSLEAPEVTEALITICDSPGGTPPIKAAGCAALSGRSDGGDQVVAALGRHAAFLEGTRGPPVAALASAAVRMEEARAVPLLVAHLRDPHTASDALPPLVEALAQLGDESTAEPLRDFLRLYHADRAEEHMINALRRAALALVELQGPDAREALEEVATDPFAIPAVSAGARGALTELERREAQAQVVEAAGEESEGAQEAAEELTEDEEAALPERIDATILQRVLAPVAAQLRACLGTVESRPRSARVILRLEGDGTIERVSITPAAAQECMEPLIRSQTFPGNRRAIRQQVIHTIRLQ